jgi:hypothetical protein
MYGSSDSLAQLVHHQALIDAQELQQLEQLFVVVGTVCLRLCVFAFMCV